MAQWKRNLLLMQETWVQSLGWEDTLEKEMATHSSILAWKIPWMGSMAGPSLWRHKGVGHDLVSKQPEGVH